jgi:AmmeMemoRadiSam system protein A
VLSDEDKRALLELARQAVASAGRGDEPPRLTNPSGALREKGAAFVTLRKRGDLRGCIGHVQALAPLWESVAEMAEAAATRDDRFPAVRPEEATGLEIEISVLSAMSPLAPGDVQVGLHGLYLRRGMQAGLLLPQVAVDWRWDAAEFIRRVHEKAGLEPGDPETKLYGFTVEHFSG